MKWYFTIKTNNKKWSMAFWPFMFLGLRANANTVEHEKIHFKQQLELLIIPHMIIYGIFHLLYGYRKNPFEREAYHFDDIPKQRRPYGWVKFL